MGQPKEGHEEGLSRKEQRAVRQRARVPARVVYQTVRAEGDEELARPAASLWWSGLAAGIAMSTSVFAQAYLLLILPENDWGHAISKLGYCLGFLIVVIGRLQLFTENTLTAVLPLLAERKLEALWRTARLWSIVLAANLLGTFLSSALSLYGGLATAEQVTAFLEVSQPVAEVAPLPALLLSIPAGFFVAAMVWMIAATKTGHVLIIVMLTYVIAIGEFVHIVVGSGEVFLLLLSGEIGIVHGLFGVIVPAIIGNVLGGTVLFALLAYGQVHQEIKSE